ncbi:MAG: GNAT family N-acetyltransferase [Deltaproteobacteria bacterium]|nr:GNAT family N-acetyltransferase [Deltaproteobacteria bacterium]
MSGGSDREILAEVMSAPRQALAPLPDTRIIERPGWFQIITPSLRQGGLNEVSLAVIEPGDADRVIDATLAEYQRLGILFRWSVGPESAPADLAARLEARGLVRSPACAMARDVGATAGEASPGIRIERVDAASVELFTRVLAEGWGMDPDPLSVFHRMLLERWPERSAMFLAFVGEAPAGVGACALLERSMFLQGAVVLPALRRRGVYHALVEARLALARRAGLSLAVIHARASTSAPILARMGFATHLEYPMMLAMRR